MGHAAPPGKHITRLHKPITFLGEPVPSAAVRIPVTLLPAIRSEGEPAVNERDSANQPIAITTIGSEYSAIGEFLLEIV
jgi:hypothetical protein